MTKKELASAIGEKLGIASKKEAEATLDAVLNCIVEGAIADGKLAIKDFGNFVVKEKKARVGRNPKTGETVDIPAKTVIKFAPAKTLKDKVAQGN